MIYVKTSMMTIETLLILYREVSKWGNIGSKVYYEGNKNG